jgi:hypothetical protein
MVTIEYNILTSARQVANTVAIIVGDFSCVRVLMICIALYIKVAVLAEWQVISRSYVCSDIYRQNKFITEKKEGWFAA